MKPVSFSSFRIDLHSGAGGCPACNSLFFASPKKSKQKKGDPAVCVPSLRYGQPAVLGPAGVKNNSPAAQTSFCPDPSGPPLLGAYRRGWGRNTEYLKKQGHAMACPCRYWIWFPHSDCPVLAGPSSADGGGRSGRSCLSEVQRSEFCGLQPESSSAGCPKRSVGTQTAGRLFFGDFLLAKQKKVTCRRQSRPRNSKHLSFQNSQETSTSSARTGRRTFSPNGLRRATP